MSALKSMSTKQQGMLTVTQVSELLAQQEFTIDQLMLSLLPLANEFATAPISNFKVGAIALGATGNLYLGANQEFENITLNEFIHAEQTAVAVAHYHGETSIEKMAVNASPCGHCRQFLYELTDANELEIILADHSRYLLNQLLPHAFGPKDLGVKGGMLTTQQPTLSLANSTTDALTLAALKAAERSYSPYNQAYAGMALQTEDGQIFTGSYLENAAFNPGLPALQSALAVIAMSGVDYKKVTRGIFVCVKDKKIGQLESTKMIFSELCQRAEFLVIASEARQPSP